MVVQHAYTVEEFEDFIAQPENVGRSFELFYGEIIKKMSTMLHALIAAFLSGMILNYLRENPIGNVLVEARYRLPDDALHDLIPDVSFVTNDRPIVAKGAAPFMPDLAVEVQSPDQSDKFMADKAAYYLANGSRMVWLLYPTKHLVEVLTLKDRQLLSDADTLGGGDVLPGFTLAIRDLFAKV